MSDTRKSETLPTLEALCPTCGGLCGTRAGDGRWQNCCDCGGAGFVPTAWGRQVLDLMRHNFGPMLREATEE